MWLHEALRGGLLVRSFRPAHAASFKHGRAAPPWNTKGAKKVSRECKGTLNQSEEFFTPLHEPVVLKDQNFRAQTAAKAEADQEGILV